MEKLLIWGVIAEEFELEETVKPEEEPNQSLPHLKEGVEWIAHPQGHWILRNPIDVTYLQVDRHSQEALQLLHRLPPEAICDRCGIPPHQLRSLLQLLAATGMLAGTTPAQPPKKKFTPLQLLFFKVPLFNPDSWLNAPARLLAWIWTKPFFLLLVAFLMGSFIFGLHQKGELLKMGSLFWQSKGMVLIIPFALLSMFVVTLHEFAHALTLKQYGGIVPEVGLLFMCLLPAAYTNTSDSYCLVKRRQRVLVVGAGILCQLFVGAIAFWLWYLATDNSSLKGLSFLLLVAALFTVTINLNPMAKFDGYYLAVAMTGINNLRGRAFMLWGNWLRWKPSGEKRGDRPILAIYAPFCLLYLILVFGGLFRWLFYWILDNIPITVLFLLVAWAIYYFFPHINNKEAA
ncbi:hypothetical protein [Spirulina sp. 06S082]|uniref:hypothetical protein n=1 Tax=Spirulina sp. 06S082 TaxID=3110248 RepID=UPI002B2187ED|nr:hypothetical protein [Spirulina sp. 06S082]MEA5468669.1 hypothetical protein [Spirulina sp. 06S082]